MNTKIKGFLRTLNQQSTIFSKVYSEAHDIKTKLTQKLPDEEYLKTKYKSETGIELNLEKPTTFTEKLQWLKLYDRKPLYTQLVDKFKVRKYVSEKIGEQYLVPLLGVWDRPESIDFDELPDQFVLKANHDSEGVIICKDKSGFDKKKALQILKKRLRTDSFLPSREWPYKNVERKIIAEKYLIDNNTVLSKTDGLVDYKFYCFNGEPKFFYLGYANSVNGQKMDQLSFNDMDWSPAAFYRKDHEPFPFHIRKPDKWDEMVQIAGKLSKGIPFVRVDLFYIQNDVYFSELTFYPGGGFGRFYPDEWERKIGGWISLPDRESL